MKYNKPIELKNSEVIIAIQSLYTKRVSNSIEICAELVQEFMKYGICRRPYRKLCSIVVSTIYKEILQAVPYYDRKMYDNHKELFGLGSINIEIRALRIYKNHKLNAIIDLTNNDVIYNADDMNNKNVLFNQLMVITEAIMHKDISTLLNSLESEENKKIFRNVRWLLYDGICGSIVPEEKIDDFNVSPSYYEKYPNVTIHINITILNKILYNIMNDIENKGPVLLATNNKDDELFIVGCGDEGKRYATMYISTNNGEVSKGIDIDHAIGAYIVFNSFISKLNTGNNYNN